MASLDDFFAKKDKRKKGKGKKFVTTEAIAKTIEAIQSPQPTQEQEKSKNDIPTAPTQEDEWKEEEEQVQDLEGLKVHRLGLDAGSESDKYSQEQRDEDENAGEGERRSGNKEGSSPWQSVTSQPPEPIPVSQPAPEKVVGGAYVPPSRRGLVGPGGRHTRAPPDLLSATAFPSLQTSVQKDEKTSKTGERGGQDFKEVQSSRSGRSDMPYRPPGLQLTNKYSMLGDN